MGTESEELRRETRRRTSIILQVRSSTSSRRGTWQGRSWLERKLYESQINTTSRAYCLPGLMKDPKRNRQDIMGMEDKTRCDKTVVLL